MADEMNISDHTGLRLHAGQEHRPVVVQRQQSLQEEYLLCDRLADDEPAQTVRRERPAEVAQKTIFVGNEERWPALLRNLQGDVVSNRPRQIHWDAPTASSCGRARRA